MCGTLVRVEARAPTVPAELNAALFKRLSEGLVPELTDAVALWRVRRGMRRGRRALESTLAPLFLKGRWRGRHASGAPFGPRFRASISACDAGHLRLIADVPLTSTWLLTERVFQPRLPFADPQEADLHWMQDDVSVARASRHVCRGDQERAFLNVCCLALIRPSSALEGRDNEPRDLPIMMTRFDALNAAPESRPC